MSTPLSDAEHRALAEKLRRSYTTRQLQGVHSYFPVLDERFRGVYVDWGMIQPITARLGLFPKRYSTYAEAETVLRLGSAEAVDDSLRELGVGIDGMRLGYSPRQEAAQTSAPGDGVNVGSPALQHIPTLPASTRSTIESWRDEVSTTLSSISSIDTLPAAVPVDPVQVELARFGLQDALDLPERWDTIRGGRPKGGWKIYAVLSDSECYITRDRSRAHSASDGVAGVAMKGFRDYHVELARAWLKSEVKQRLATQRALLSASLLNA